MTLTQSLTLGVYRIKQRIGLVVLIYAIQALFAGLLALISYSLLNNAVSSSGFSQELAQHFDLTLWADIVQEGLGWHRSIR